MKRFAKFLQFREEALKIDDLEQRYGLTLPPIFRAFSTQFKGILGDIYQDSDGKLQTLTYLEYRAKSLNGRDLMFEDFLPTEKVFKNAKNSDLWTAHVVAPISQHAHGGTIVVGLRPENLDKLYFEHDRGLEFIEEDIFSFISNLDLVAPNTLMQTAYRRWGEDFWRIA